MEQFLERGCTIDTDNRIKKMISAGEYWQIYLSNLDSYVLAVKDELYDLWLNYYSVPEGIFLPDKIQDCHIYICSGDYFISSIEYGPFPDNLGQVEAFSVAFKRAMDLFDNIDIHDAIYIEQYSLILPLSTNTTGQDNGLVYGRWLTGGINVPIESLDRVSQIMSWLPVHAIINSAKLAGFDLNIADSNDSENREKREGNQLLISNQMMSEQFSLIGRQELEQFFNEKIIDIVLHQDQYQRMGISFPGATILYGPPGCGKTYAVKKVAEYLGWKRFDIDSSTIASSYIHDTSKKISEIFEAAIAAAPSILVIDEMEAFLSERGMVGTSGIYHVEEVAEFLRKIPEAVSKGVLVFAMTNMIDSIDSAILRKGRFDYIIEVKMAMAEEIEDLLKSKFKNLPVDNTVNVKDIAEKLAGFPMSDITFVLREAGRIAVSDDLNYINEQCFYDAINQLPKKKEKKQIGFNCVKEK